jgi:hypothetical protein
VVEIGDWVRKMINLEQVDQLVAMVKGAVTARDFEKAHSIQDDLYVSVLIAVSVGANDSVDLAEAALKVAELDFPRWAG